MVFVAVVMEAPAGPMTPDTDGTDEEKSGEESGEMPAEEAAVPSGMILALLMQLPQYFQWM